MKAYRYFANPELLGGDLDLRVVQLSQAHFSQTDTSQNARIWAVFPLEADGGQQAEDMPAMVGREGLSKTDPTYVKMEGERSQCCAKIRGLHTISSMGSAVPMQVAIQRRRTGDVRPLQAAMECVTAKKEVVNKLFAGGEYTAAVHGYAACLWELMPWHASQPAVHDLGAGVRYRPRATSALWNNLHISAIKADLHGLLKLDLSTTTFECVNLMRYAPTKALYKARWRYVQGYDDYGHVSARPGIAANNKAMRECADAMLNKNSDEWAHRHCITEHMCFSDQFRAKARAFEIEERRLESARRNPLDDLE